MLAAPLTDLLRYNKLQWNTTAESAFTAMKTKMTTMPVLQLPNFSKVFLIETDTLGVAIGAVLSQGGHPLAYFSKKLNPKMELASAYVREMYAVTESVKKVASILDRAAISNIYRSKKPERLITSKNTNPGTTKMG